LNPVKFTIAIQLTSAADREQWLTGVFLVRAELTMGAFRRDAFRALGISKGKVVVSASLGLAGGVGCAEIFRAAITIKLIGTNLETTVGDFACAISADATSVNYSIPRETKECER
jgi:hypothetical protein